MNLQALERKKQRWLIAAADSVPQLILLVDRAGRVLHASRTLERWDVDRAGPIRGLTVHDLLHRHCRDAGCSLRLFWQQAAVALANDGRAECDFQDPLLNRHLMIRSEMPAQDDGDRYSELFAMVTIDDVSALMASVGRSGMIARTVTRRVEREAQKLSEKFESRLRTILDKSQLFAAMADHRGALFYLNPAGRKMLGLAEEESLTGLSLVQCLAPRAQARLVEEALPAADSDGVWAADSLLWSRNGGEIETYLTLIAHREENGRRLEGYSLLGRDRSDWLRTEEALRLTRIEMSRLSAQHLTIQESERRRIAADLHDGVGQTLSLVKLSIEAVVRLVSSGGAGNAAADLERLVPTVKSAMAELRNICMNLRPSTLDDLGILATLAWYFREFEAACPDVSLERDISVAEDDVHQLLKITVFRIVQEAISNALKHAGASHIRVSLHGQDGAVELVIEDDGQGFDPARASSGHEFGRGLGLQSMNERTELSGGEYELSSVPGKGTRVRAYWPALTSAECELVAGHAPGHVSQQENPADPPLPERYSQCLACMTRERNP